MGARDVLLTTSDMRVACCAVGGQPCSLARMHSRHEGRGLPSCLPGSLAQHTDSVYTLRVYCCAAGRVCASGSCSARSTSPRAHALCSGRGAPRASGWWWPVTTGAAAAAAAAVLMAAVWLGPSRREAGGRGLGGHPPQARAHRGCGSSSSSRPLQLQPRQPQPQLPQLLTQLLRLEHGCAEEVLRPSQCCLRAGRHFWLQL